MENRKTVERTGRFPVEFVSKVISFCVSQLHVELCLRVFVFSVFKQKNLIFIEHLVYWLNAAFFIEVVGFTQKSEFYGRESCNNNWAMRLF